MGERNADVVLCAARVALAAALLPQGWSRALNVSGFALTVAGTGMPYPNGVATLLVVINVFGPLALIAGIVPRLTGAALAAFGLLTTLLLHRFWDLPVGPMRAGELELFLAGLGLVGGFVLYALAGPGLWSWQGLWHRQAPSPPARASGAKASRSAGKPASRKRAEASLAKAA